MAKPINLALQGGGAHGAYAWGVLDRILEGGELRIAAISGTSAGALNGAALKAGFAAGGPEGARAALAALWGRVAGVGGPALASWLAPFTPGNRALSAALSQSPAYIWGEAVSRATSPYALGPFYANPLRPIVEEFDFDGVCGDNGPALFVCATRVRDGRARVFSGDEIDTDAILASACLPTLFQAVEIDGEGYWDGGYTGNPALFPLYETRFPDDVVIVNINPLRREELPKSAPEILNRINEVSFNASLLADLRAIRFVQRLIDAGRVPRGAMKYVLVHMIDDTAMMADLSVATKVLPSPVLIDRMFRAGRAAAEGFVAAHLGDVGERSTVDLAGMYD
ncbi:patatin-like phospholipase family protein [Palleronia sediminis]|uniref:Patatin-like phospholipase family protein n=1 Tax=Palleronia sediminis TaxID=2547833 RepID=A0A4R6AA02_9RHOB|nr:patatin-like phospholipase family protein [Palleronia sediminis]TDL79544.1 patatin-like phospholipase family protein [Palleronia sediminis]